MKLTTLLLLIGALHVGATGSAQVVTLSAKNITLVQVFKAIEKQTSCGVFYDAYLLHDARRVSIDVKDARLTEVLDKALKDQPYEYNIVERTIFISRKAATITPLSEKKSLPPPVTGSVTNENGTPIPGVSIQVKGTTRGVSADENGRFSIDVPSDATLVFTSVGYLTQEVKINNRMALAIVMQLSPSQLTDVVVIGYGSRQRKDVTGSLATVKAEDIEKSTSPSPELALQGKAAGVFIESGGGAPGARPTVRIRGVNTFGYADPLYVVDGVPIYEGGAGASSGVLGDLRSPLNILSMISPGDIESMTVLKDASAAAIYGVRASNGVIIITTKKGKAGKSRIEVNASYGVQNIAKKINNLNTSQYFDLMREAYNNNPDANTSFGQKFGPRYDEADPSYAGNGPTYDWFDELLNKNAALKDYNVRVSGGNEGVNYYFSGGYTNQESPLKGNNIKRYSVAANIESKFSRFIKVGLTLRLVDEQALTNTRGTLVDMMSTIPFQPIYDANDVTGFVPTTASNFIPNPDYNPALLSPGAPYIFENGDPGLLWGPQTRFNVFAFQALNNTNYELMRALGNAYVQIEPVKGLSIKGSLGGDWYENIRRSWQDNDAWRFSQTIANPYANQDGKAKGSYRELITRTYNLNKELTVNYNHTFAGEHNFDVILSASDQFAQWKVNDASGLVNYTDPQYWNVPDQPPFSKGSSQILQEDELIGYLGRLSYKFKNKYYLDATYRYDGSSRLAPGNKWAGFPSFSLAWRISEEKFFPRQSFVNDLKLRGGWGKLGNFQSAGYYKFLSTISLNPDYTTGSGNGNGYGTQLQGAALPDFANNTLTWERIKTTSMGLDASLFNDHVSFTFDYYNKITYNIIQSISLPPNTGIQGQADLNIAQVRNSGIELQLGYNRKFGPVDFSVSGNITTVKNEVQKLYGGHPLGSESGRIEEGYPMGYLWGYKVGGIFQRQEEIDQWRMSHADVDASQNLTNKSEGYQFKPGDMYFQDIHGNPTKTGERYSAAPDSLVNANDRTYLGKVIPGYYYGLSLSAAYKGIDISVFFQGVGDVQKYNGIRLGLESMSTPANQWTTVLDRWTPGHPSSTMPRAVYGDPAKSMRFSDRVVENAGYLRLKNVQVGYRVPGSLLQKANFIQGLRFYVSAVNLFTITKYTGLDPENDILPPARQFLFGINASF